MEDPRTLLGWIPVLGVLAIGCAAYETSPTQMPDLVGSACYVNRSLKAWDTPTGTDWSFRLLNAQPYRVSKCPNLSMRGCRPTETTTKCPNLTVTCRITPLTTPPPPPGKESGV